MNIPLILHSAGSGEGTPLPLVLSGYPTEIEGQRCHYRRKELARVGKYTHRGTREPFELSAARLDAIAAAFNARIAKGIKPFVADRHTLEPAAGQGKGFVVALHRQGDALHADLQLVGDEALSLCAANDVSLCTLADQIDADGVKYPEVLHHVALTPNPALSNLGPFVKIAASAGGGSAIDAPIYDAADKESPMFKPEQLEKLRAKFHGKDAAKLTDDQFAEAVVAAALTEPPADLTPQVTALSADKTRLEGELTAAKADLEAKSLALSASAPKELDPMSLALITRAFKTERDQLIASGVVSEAGMNEIDALCGVGHKQAIALSLSAGGTDPFYIRLCEVLRRNPGVKTGNDVTRATPSLQLSADPSTEEPISAERLAYAAQCMGVAVPAAKSA